MGKEILQIANCNVKLMARQEQKCNKKKINFSVICTTIPILLS